MVTILSRGRWVYFWHCANVPDLRRRHFKDFFRTRCFYFHLDLLTLRVWQTWSRQRIGAEQATSHCLQYSPRNMHTVFALLCFVVVIHWLIFPYPSGLLHWHCGNLTIAPVPAKQPWWIWINTSCEFIMNDCITTTKQSTTKPCAYFLGYTVDQLCWRPLMH